MSALAEKAIEIRRSLLNQALQKKSLEISKNINILEEPYLFELDFVKQSEQILNKQETEWKKEDKVLIEWLLAQQELPETPFILEQAVTILSPIKFYEYLKGDIAAGANGCRAKTGALQSDLKKLKQLMEKDRQVDDRPCN